MPSLPADLRRPALKPAMWIIAVTVFFYLVGPSAFSHTTFASFVRTAYVLAVLGLGYVWFRRDGDMPDIAKIALSVGFAVFAFWLSASINRPYLGETGTGYAGGSLFGILVVAAIPCYFIYIVGHLIWHASINPALVRDHVRRASASGYVPPVMWLVKDDSGDHPPISLVSKHLLYVRSAMPPFILWYEEGAHDGQNRQQRSKWVYVVDGNPRLANPGSEMPNYIQFMAKGVSGLGLFSISPEVAHNLNRGTYRTESVPMVSYPDGKHWSYFLHMGGVAAPAQRDPAPPSGNQGTGREGTGSKTSEAL